MIRIGPNEEYILREVTDQIDSILNSVGIFNRVFSRVKTGNSISQKLSEKHDDYLKRGKKMQDAFGIRVTVYFADDEEIAIHLIKKKFIECPDDHSIDPLNKERFGPQRCNLIFKIPEFLLQSSSLFDNELIDSTFEVQFRTIYSEWWHEVEHDLRYKCKKDWENEDILSRQLNGQLASLGNCDWVMLKIFDELAYTKYKNHQWSSFFRNIVRIRFEDHELSDEIKAILDKKPNLAKEMLRSERKKLIYPLSKLSTRIPLKMDNVFFTVNRIIFEDKDIEAIEPQLIKQILDKSLSE